MFFFVFYIIGGWVGVSEANVDKSTFFKTLPLAASPQWIKEKILIRSQLDAQQKV